MQTEEGLNVHTFEAPETDGGEDGHSPADEEPDLEHGAEWGGFETEEVNDELGHSNPSDTVMATDGAVEAGVEIVVEDEGEHLDGNEDFVNPVQAGTGGVPDGNALGVSRSLEPRPRRSPRTNGWTVFVDVTSGKRNVETLNVRADCNHSQCFFNLLGFQPAEYVVSSSSWFRKPIDSLKL